MFYKDHLKRILDIIISLLSIVLLSPIMIFTYFIILIKLGNPVIFKQERPGRNEKIFIMYKFKSMLDLTDNLGNQLSDDQRLTKFGKLLRSTSIDELPGLFNVLKGDMSLVGPRPLLVAYLPLYNDIQRKRHDVRPGLTGLAQISGRNLLTWEEKFSLDIKYINNLTFRNDLIILFRTVAKVFLKEGISSMDSVTMEPFLGDTNE